MLDFQPREAPVRSGNRKVRFGAFEIDPDSGEVWESGQPIKLQDQPFKVLRLLLEHHGDLVTREELRLRPRRKYRGRQAPGGPR